jgi:tRNA nucleotidyltransferase/poly(A) polymerase
MDTLLTSFAEFLKKEAAYEQTFIVGGAVRDFLLNSTIKDIDIALKGNAIEIARDFSAKADATFVMLDEDHGVARIVKDRRHIDISKMQGASIYDDLANRDITINAMAIPIAALDPAAVIDPLGGKADLDGKIIKMVSKNNLLKDPLRLLRVYRFAAELSFSIEGNTIDAVKKYSYLIKTVAVERIMDELHHILVLENSCPFVAAMLSDGLLYNILPEIKTLGKNKILENYRAVESFLNVQCLAPNVSESFKKYFRPAYRKAAVKLAVFFSQPDEANKAAMRLKIPGRERVLIQMLVCNRDILQTLISEKKKPEENDKIIKILKMTGDDIYALTVFAAAHSIQTVCQSSYAELLSFYEDVFKKRMAILPLITGNDIMKTFALSPSPLIGKILGEIRDRVLEGKIFSKTEALCKAREIIKNS